jgi:hypothetical protein
MNRNEKQLSSNLLVRAKQRPAAESIAVSLLLNCSLPMVPPDQAPRNRVGWEQGNQPQ